jgi:hypothetical protein
VITAALALVLCAAQGEPAFDPQLAVWLELDTNAPRVTDDVRGAHDDDGKIIAPRVASEAPRPIADGLVRGDFSLVARLHGPDFALRSESAVGGKYFFTQESERMVVGQSRATLSTSTLPGGALLTLVAFAKGRAQVSGARSYGLLRTDALIDKEVLPWLVLRGGASAQGFRAFDAELFSSAGGGALVGGRAVIGAAEHIDVLVDAGGRYFPFAARDPNPPATDLDRRIDAVVSGIVQITSARSVHLSAAYLLTRNASNARGESFTRHRLTAMAGFRLPGDVTCTALGAVQITSYQDGVTDGQAYYLGDDEDSQNVLELSIAKRIHAGVSIEGRASFFGNELAVEGERFSRQITAVGIRAVL